MVAEKQLPEKSPEVSPAAQKATELSSEIIQEIWEETYLQGVKVGFARTEFAKVREDNTTLVRCRQTGELHLKRDGQASDQVMAFTCWQSEDGKLLRFESSMEGGGSKTLGSGKLEGKQLRTQTHTVGNTQRQSFDWQGDWGGYFAQDESLRKQPLKPGETRTIVSLTPILNAPTATKLESPDYENTDLKSGPQKLLKVRSITALGEQTLETLLWVNAQGEILKTRMPGLGLETYRTTKSAATNLATIGSVDLLRSMVVKPTDGANAKRKREEFEKLSMSLASARHAVFIARLKEGNVAKAFSNCPSQEVKIIDEHMLADASSIRLIFPRCWIKNLCSHPPP